MTQDNDNSGVLFKNKDRKTDSHPNARGSAVIGGKEYWVSAWTNVAGPNAKNPGEVYQSLKFSEKDEQPKAAPPITGDGIDDDIPF